MIKPERDINDITWAYLRDDDLSRSDPTHRIIYILDCLFSTEPEVFAENILAPMADDAFFHPDLRTRLDAYACFVDTKNLMRLSTSPAYTYKRYTSISLRKGWSSDKINTESPVSFWDGENKINIKGWDFSKEAVDSTVFKERYKNTLHNERMHFAFKGKSKKRDTTDHINAVAESFYRLSPNIPLMLGTPADKENALSRLSQIIKSDIKPLIVQCCFGRNACFGDKILFNENNFNKEAPCPQKGTVFFYEEDFDISSEQFDRLLESTNITPTDILRRIDTFKTMTDMTYPFIQGYEENFLFLKNRNFQESHVPYGFLALASMRAGSSSAKEAVEALNVLSEHRRRQTNFLNTDEIDILMAKVLRGTMSLSDQDRRFAAKAFSEARLYVAPTRFYARYVESNMTDSFLINGYIDASARDKEIFISALSSIKNRHAENADILTTEGKKITSFAASACFSVEGLTSAQNRVLNELKNTLMPQTLLHAMPAFAILSDRVGQQERRIKTGSSTADGMSSYLSAPRILHVKRENLPFLLSVLAAASYVEQPYKNTLYSPCALIEFHKKTEWTENSYWRIGDWESHKTEDRRPFENLHQLIKNQADNMVEPATQLIAPYAEYFNSDLNAIRTCLASALPLYVLNGISPDVDGSAENMHQNTIKLLEMADEGEISADRKYPKNFISFLTPPPAQWGMQIEQARENLFKPKGEIVTELKQIKTHTNKRPHEQLSFNFEME